MKLLCDQFSNSMSKSEKLTYKHKFFASFQQTEVFEKTLQFWKITMFPQKDDIYQFFNSKKLG
jgi:hypothetical protein